MPDFNNTALLFISATSLAAGYYGSLLGLGGGFVLVPTLTIFFNVEMRTAVGVALIAVIATSSGSSVKFLKDSYSNLELASFLEISTIAGAIFGVYLSKYIPIQILYFFFAFLLLAASYAMLKKNRTNKATTNVDSLISDHAQYKPTIKGTLPPEIYNGEKRHLTEYKVKRPLIGFAISGFAGIMSGLLGVGGGIIKVPTMNILMNVPLKAASATSNLMVGMTAATSAIILLLHNQIPLKLSALVAMSVYVGATLGSHQLRKTSNRRLSELFFLFCVIMAIQMLIKGSNA